MKVRNVIEFLSQLDEDEEIVIDWSSKKWFEMDIDKQISEEAWQWVVRFTTGRDVYVIQDRLEIMKYGLADYEKREGV